MKKMNSVIEINPWKYIAEEKNDVRTLFHTLENDANIIFSFRLSSFFHGSGATWKELRTEYLLVD